MKVKNTEDVAVLIRRARKQQQLTQTELAGLCNVGVRFIVDIEAGKPTCQIGKVLSVLNILGLKTEIGD